MNGRYGQVLAVVGPQTCQYPRRTQQWSRRTTAYGPNRVRTLFTLVRSKADSWERCNSADVKAFVLKRWKLASCLCPPWRLFKWVHPE